MKSDGVILIVMVIFYVPALSLLILGKRSWMDVLAVGLIASILAMTVNRWLPPVGTMERLGSDLELGFR